MNMRLNFRNPAPVRIEVNKLTVGFLAPSPRLNLEFPGVQGPPGRGLPPGGATGQIARKASGTDYDVFWDDEGGSVTVDWVDVTGKPTTFPPSAHSHAIADVTGLQGALNAKQDALTYTPEDAAQKGVAGGYAGLDGSGKVPSSQLPSFVDDVLEFANLAAVPGTGEAGKIYVAIDTGRTYRWSGSAYVEISASPGSTDAVPEGSVNLYHTPARVRGTDLTGYAAAGSRTALASSDTVLGAFAKIGKWLADLGGAAFASATTAGLAMLTAASAAAQTALLDTFTSGAKGLAPPSGGGTTNFLRADGSWAAPPGGGGGATNLSYDAATRTIASDTGTDAVLTLVDNTNAGLAVAPEAGPDRFFAFTDFIGTTTSEFWAVNTAGAGSAQPAVAPQDGRIGWVRADLGTTATGRSSFGSATFNLRFGLGRARCRARLRISTLSTGTETWTLRVGFVDNLAGESTDGAFFRYTDGANSGRFQAVTRSNGVETAADTGITAAANTTYRFDVEVNAAGSSVTFRIDGAVVATITTNIPTGSGRETGWGIVALKSAGTTATTAAWYDYLWVEQTFTGG